MSINSSLRGKVFVPNDDFPAWDTADILTVSYPWRRILSAVLIRAAAGRSIDDNDDINLLLDELYE
jgi:hypothetical protein